MGVFCDRLKLCSTAALDCRTGQNKGRYHEKELLLLLVSLVHQHHILATVLLSTNLSGPEPLTQVAVLSSDNEQDVYTLLALQIRFEAKSKEIIDKI